MNFFWLYIQFLLSYHIRTGVRYSGLLNPLGSTVILKKAKIFKREQIVFSSWIMLIIFYVSLWEWLPCYEKYSPICWEYMKDKIYEIVKKIALVKRTRSSFINRRSHFAVIYVLGYYFIPWNKPSSLWSRCCLKCKANILAICFYNLN